MLIGLTLEYIGVEKLLVYTLTGLMVLDWITGIVRAWKIGGGESITSRKSSKGLIAKFALLVIPIAIGFTLKVVDIPIGVTVKMAFSLLCVSELYSVIGNLYTIYSGEEQREFDAASAVIKYLRKSMMDVFKKITHDNPEKGVNKKKDKT